MLARVRRPNNLLAAWSTITCVDFNKEGMAFLADVDLDIGETVLLSLHIHMSRSTLEAENVVAVVRSRKTQDHMNRFGVQFNFDANRIMRGIKLQSVLGRMEGIMDRSFKQRLRNAVPEAYPSH